MKPATITHHAPKTKSIMSAFRDRKPLATTGVLSECTKVYTGVKKGLARLGSTSTREFPKIGGGKGPYNEDPTNLLFRAL